MNYKIRFAGTIFVCSLNENWRLCFIVRVVLGMTLSFDFSSCSIYSPPIPSSVCLWLGQLPLEAFLFCSQVTLHIMTTCTVSKKCSKLCIDLSDLITIAWFILIFIITFIPCNLKCGNWLIFYMRAKLGQHRDKKRSCFIIVAWIVYYN